MQEFHLSWPESDATLDDGAAVEEMLAELDRKFALQRRSVLVGIDGDDASLDVGLGTMHCAVYVEGGQDSGFVTVGESGAEEPLPFEAGGEVTHLPALAMIRREDCLAAAKEFVTTGKRPVCVSWQAF